MTEAESFQEMRKRMVLAESENARLKKELAKHSPFYDREEMDWYCDYEGGPAPKRGKSARSARDASVRSSP